MWMARWLKGVIVCGLLLALVACSTGQAPAPSPSPKSEIRTPYSPAPTPDWLAVNDFLARTTAWRAVIGKTFGVVSFSAGFGQDQHEVSALADVRVVRTGVTYRAGPIAAIQEMTRDNAFGSVALRLPVLSIVGEYGRISGGRLATFNTFGGTRADDRLEYASVGLRFRF